MHYLDLKAIAMANSNKIDSMAFGMAFRNMRNAALQLEAHHGSKVHNVDGRQVLDPSLVSQMVYKNRPDWMIAAACCGFIHVDVPLSKGARRFIPMSQAKAISVSVMANKPKDGFNLYG